MRFYTALLVMTVGTLFVAAQDAAVRAEDGRKPNIILVMADDQGWGDVGYNGHPFVQTPELDAMAKDGFVFDRFYAAAPVCSPTRASVMTGRNPIRTKVTNHGRYMRPHEQTIAESLQAAGYVTGIFGKVHLGSGQPDSPCNPTGMGFDEWVIGLNFFDNDPYLSRNGRIEHRKGKGSVIAMDDALAFLKKYKESDQPMFAVVWFPSPHDPHQEVPEGPPHYNGKKQAGYYREITLLDQQLGRLRRELRSQDIADNTILWYCSDNGGLNEATSGGRKRKGSIYEGGLRIPGIIEWPVRKLKGRTSVPTWTCDIYPTVLAMAGVDVEFPHPLDGTDISDIIEGKKDKRSKPMGFWHQFQQGQSTWSDRIQKAIMEKQQAGDSVPHNEHRIRKDVDEFPQFSEDVATGHAAWNDWPWKLHRINGKKYELYNLVDDPMETTDRSGDPDQQARLDTMKNELNGWMRSVIRSINGKDYGRVVAGLQKNEQAVHTDEPVRHLFVAKLLLRRMESVDLTAGQLQAFNRLSRVLRARIDRKRKDVGITKELIKRRDEVYGKLKKTDLSGDALWMTLQKQAELTNAQRDVFRETQEEYAEFRTAALALLTAEQRKRLQKSKRKPNESSVSAVDNVARDRRSAAFV